jgi:hypothetical protein
VIPDAREEAPDSMRVTVSSSLLVTQGHGALEVQVLGEIDHAHPAAPDQAVDSVAGRYAADPRVCLHGAT